jgi:hypothetical protein
VKKIFLLTALPVFLMLAAGAGTIYAQPSDAQIKKQIMGAKTVSVTLNGPGKIEWSKTYKKYVYTRYFTAKVRTDEPGVFVIVKGYALYDVMGGRYVFWRTFTSGNTYEGKNNPTVAEINQALQTATLADFNFNDRVIGEYESLKLAADPEWEWHTTDSVSFNVVAVYQIHNSGGRYFDGTWHQSPSGTEQINRVESVLRLRLYRDGAKLPWRGIHVSDRVPTSPGANRIDEKIRLLEQKNYPVAEFRQMAKMSKLPTLSQ